MSIFYKLQNDSGNLCIKSMLNARKKLFLVLLAICILLCDQDPFQTSVLTNLNS